MMGRCGGYMVEAFLTVLHHVVFDAVVILCQPYIVKHYRNNGLHLFVLNLKDATLAVEGLREDEAREVGHL